MIRSKGEAMDDERDDLRAARGIVTGLAVSVVIWAAIFAVVIWGA